MNCFYHDNKPAIVSCAKCGVGLCKDCMTNAAYTYDGKPLCLNCSKTLALEELKDARSNKLWSLVKFIFSGFFLGIGLMALSGNADIMQVWIISGIAGIPTAFKASHRSREQRIMDEIQDRFETDIINLMFGWALRLLFKLVFIIGLAPICAIYTFLSNLIKFIRSNKKINEAKKALDYINQCLNEEQEQDSIIGYEPQISCHSSYVPVQPENSAQQFVSSQITADTIYTQPTQTFQTPPVEPDCQTLTPKKRNNSMIISIFIFAIIIGGLIVGYFIWYIPYAQDKEALRTYVVANNLFLRSSKVAGVEYNILSKVSYGTELITYSKDAEWAKIKINGMKGYVASSYLLDLKDFNLLNNVWGSMDTKEYIESSKCRLAILDYCKRNQFTTGKESWQLYTLHKNVKPNNVFFPRLDNGYNKFTEFAFILKNNATQERRFAIYSFDEETEKPIFLYEEIAPIEGHIKNIKYNNEMNEYSVTYTDINTFTKIETISTKIDQNISKIQYDSLTTETKHKIMGNDSSIDTTIKKVEDIELSEAIELINKVNEINLPGDIELVEDNNIYEVVEQMPEFPNGGMAGLMNFISKNLKYPIVCQKSGVQGKVLISFVINKDGSATDFRVVSSVDKYLDNEALRVLNLMPKWTPGKLKGVPVRVKYIVPINFRLS